MNVTAAGGDCSLGVLKELVQVGGGLADPPLEACGEAAVVDHREVSDILAEPNSAGVRADFDVLLCRDEQHCEGTTEERDTESMRARERHMRAWSSTSKRAGDKAAAEGLTR